MLTSIDLVNQNYPPEQLAELAVKDESFMRVMLDGISPAPRKDALRWNCSSTLLHISEHKPLTLLPHWDVCVDYLGARNAFTQYVAVYLLSAMVKVAPGKYDAEVNEKLMSVLENKSVMAAAHAALNAGRVAAVVPEYRDQITRRLLELDRKKLFSGNQGLVAAYVIDALELVFESSPLKGEIFKYVETQLVNESPKTRSRAKAFLKQWSG
jgi:hypothetical protein